MEKTIHQGRNIKRFREMMGIKQEAFAAELGEDWSQRRVSLLEQKEVVDDDILEQVAKVLKVPSEAIKNFDEEKAINIISNTFNDHAINMNYQCTFNPLEKIVQLYDEKVALYERMLKDKEEMIGKLEELSNKK